ncbi:MAG: hypothetical protein MR215_07375 [Bacteroidales bacterium]|nr:hypothetical protein [Bacteroidales bacterium]
MTIKNYVLVVTAVILSACGETEIESPELTLDDAKTTETEIEATVPFTHGATVLGERIPNAYTPEHMRKALAAIKAEGGGNKALAINEEDIEATHLYLKFAPRDSAEVELLDNDKEIMYTVIPMDREIEQIGDYYHDPSLPDSVPTYQYCVARIGQDLPNVPHETLSELYLLEEANVFEDCDNDLNANKATYVSIWERLESKALELAGVVIETESGNKSSKWRPEGNLKYYDNTLKREVAMEGVPVRIHRGFTTHQCCTDANGHFSFSKRRHHIRCYVKWRRDDFHLREIGHPFQQAESTICSHMKSSVNHTFVHGYDSWYYASIFRAAHEYYYHYQKYGLSRPKEGNLKIKLSERHPSENGTFHAASVIGALGLPDISIYYSKDNMDSSAQLFKTTVHEIGHCAHHAWRRMDYHGTADKVKESWARGVEWVMALPMYGDNLAKHDGSSTYTMVVRDLLDDSNLYRTGLNNKTYKKKTPCCISMSDIEKALHGAKRWNEWRDNLMKLYPSKKDDINGVFKIWEN